jgi:hypothetical protein
VGAAQAGLLDVVLQLVKAMIEPSESNPFARAVRGTPSASRWKLSARLLLAIAITLLLAAMVTIALFLIGALIVRGVRHGDYRALGAALAVIAMSTVMARSRRRN